MTSYQQRDNEGSLFKNDRKESDRHPDYTGKVMVDGRMYWLSAWVKRPDGKAPFFSLALKPQDAAQSGGGGYSSGRQAPARAAPARAMPQRSTPLDEDSIPFHAEF